MDDPAGGPRAAERALLERVGRLEKVLGAITPEELQALGRVVREAESREAGGWDPTTRFWFSGTGGARLTRVHDRALRLLWTRLLVALTRSIAAVDLDPAAQVRTDEGPIQTLRSQSIEGRATTLIEKRLGDEAWLSATVVWNASCAALLSDSIGPELGRELEAAWRQVFPWTPLERISDERD